MHPDKTFIGRWRKDREFLGVRVVAKENPQVLPARGSEEPVPPTGEPLPKPPNGKSERVERPRRLPSIGITVGADTSISLALFPG